MESQTRIERLTEQITVNSTALIRKKTRRNLAKNAVNRFARNRASRASELLASINESGHKVTSPPGAVSGNPFLPPRLNKGDFVFGLDRRGNELRICRQYLNVHILVLAGTGSGKTVLSKYQAIQKLIVHAMNSELLGRDLSEWLETIPEKLRDRLAQVGIIDPAKAAASKTLAQHLQDYRVFLSPGNTETYVEDTCSRVERVLRACRFRYWSDISASRVKEAIAGFHKTVEVVEKTMDSGKVVRRKVTKDLGPLSCKTKNYYLGAIKGFARWMVKDRRAVQSPIEYLDKIKYVDDDHRRALSTDEVCRLLAATETGPKRFGMTGHERAVLYLATIETGLRVRELRGLKVSSFDLDEATVTAEARRCKNRKEAVQLLRWARLKPLRGFFAGRGASDRAFNMPTHHYTADMLKADLAAADIEYIDGAGRKADFHCLRHTLATALDQTGASLKERMTIMRHSDRSNLTLGTYTHVQSYNIR